MNFKSNSDFTKEVMNLTDELVEKINKKKLEIIISKLEENNIEFDWEFEKKARFKSLSVEQYDNKETFYYNDGSKEGLRIVTFEIEDWMKKPLLPITDGDKIELKIEMNFKYY